MVPSAQTCSSQWDRDGPVGGKTRIASDSLRPGCHSSTHTDKTEVPTVASRHRVIKDDKSQEVEEEGKCERKDEELNLPPPGNMTVIYSSTADDEGPTEKPC